MNRRLLAAAAIASAVFAVALREAPSAQGGSAWVAPRTPWGDPDLQGVWPGTAMMGVPIELRASLVSERRSATKNSRPRGQLRHAQHPERVEGRRTAGTLNRGLARGAVCATCFRPRAWCAFEA